MKSMIAIEHLSIRFRDLQVLADFSLALAKGEKAVVSGRSGSGKSTLLQALLGFVEIGQGEIRMDGLKLGPETIQEIRQRIAWLPQELGLALPTAGELFYYPYTFKRNQGLRPDSESVRAMLDRLELPVEILQKRSFEISGGQKQRLLAASLLLMKRPVMLLDEPTAALDRHSAKLLLAAVSALEETTVLAATHDPQWKEGLDRSLELEGKA
ncbi:MAG: ABC transporter ATP-binding protein [Thermodesulfobacteriota bacterium]